MPPIPIALPIVLVAAAAATATAKISSSSQSDSDSSLLANSHSHALSYSNSSGSSTHHPPHLASSTSQYLRQRSRSLSSENLTSHASINNNLPSHYQQRNVDHRLPRNNGPVSSQFNHIRQRSVSSGSVPGVNTATLPKLPPGTGAKHGRTGSVAVVGLSRSSSSRHSRTATQGRIRAQDHRRHSAL